MRLKKLSDFRRENFEPDANGHLPDMRSLQKWDGVFKQGGTWYIDLDALPMFEKMQKSLHDTMADIAGDDRDLKELISA